MVPFLTIEGVVIDPVLGRLSVSPYRLTNVIKVFAFVRQDKFRQVWSEEALSEVTYVHINGVKYEPVKWVDTETASWFKITEAFPDAMEMTLVMLLRQV